MFSPVSKMVDADDLPAHDLVYVGHECAEECASEVVGTELWTKVGRGELDKGLLAGDMIAAVRLAQGSVILSAIEDVRNDDAREGFLGEEDADMDPIVPGGDKEGMLGKLDKHSDG